MSDITLADELSCARRELRLRRTTYPRWVAQGLYNMTPVQAEWQIACMEAIVRRLERLVEAESQQRSLWGEGATS